jgi:cell division protein FtsX
MLEGFIHGMAGAVLAFVLTYVVRNGIASFLPDETILGTNQLFVTPHEAVYTGIVLLLIGAAVGVLGSAFAVRRYLSV